MKRPIITEHNLATEEKFEREMNDDEYKAYLSEIESQEKKRQDEVLLNAKKAELLAKLGITEDDAKLLLS